MKGPDGEAIALAQIGGNFKKKLRAAYLKAGKVAVSTLFDETNVFTMGEMNDFCTGNSSHNGTSVTPKPLWDRPWFLACIAVVSILFTFVVGFLSGRRLGSVQRNQRTVVNDNAQLEDNLLGSEISDDAAPE